MNALCMCFFGPLVVNLHVVKMPNRATTFLSLVLPLLCLPFPSPAPLYHDGRSNRGGHPLATLLQRPSVLTAISVVLPPLLQPANIDEGAVRNRFCSKGRKGDGGPAHPPPPPLLPLNKR